QVEALDHALVWSAGRARGGRVANVLRLIGAVDAIERIPAAFVKIHRPGAHRVVRSGADEIGNVGHAVLDLGGGRPRRPFLHPSDLGDAGPGEGFLADGDAVADRLALRQHVVEVPVVAIADAGPGGL